MNDFALIIFSRYYTLKSLKSSDKTSTCKTKLRVVFQTTIVGDNTSSVCTQLLAWKEKTNWQPSWKVFLFKLSGPYNVKIAIVTKNHVFEVALKHGANLFIMQHCWKPWEKVMTKCEMHCERRFPRPGTKLKEKLK